jgi:type II secretory pathway pseudopilin PulG
MSRRQHGQALVELLIASSISALIASAILAVLLVNFHSNAKVENVNETSEAVRLIKQKIGMDVREGRSLGDCYGTWTSEPLLPSNGGPIPPPNFVMSGSSTFPSSGDPNYVNGAMPNNLAWPTWASVGTQTSYTLKNTCLIVQVPVTDLHNDSGSVHQSNPNAPGFPTLVPVGPPIVPAANAYNAVNAETHVYMVVPDPNNPGEYIMQFCCFPGGAIPVQNGPPGTGTNAAGVAYTVNYSPAAHFLGPETILTGIIGPLDSTTNLPKVFQFVDKTDPTGTPQNTVPNGGALVGNFTGVVINLEVRKHDTSSLARKDISLQPVAFKTEVFLRNNAMATPVGSQ